MPMVGGPVIAMLMGFLFAPLVKKHDFLKSGILFTSKKILQYAVIFLGFGLNLGVVFETGKESLPIILVTITTSLIVAFILSKLLKISSNIATLIGVGSSICGGSAIAATAPIIDALDEEVVQSISVIFLFNIIAAVLFPLLGNWLGFSTVSGDAFGIFAGTAINDTSSVTAASSTWDSMYHLGNSTLDKAVTVKLTRTLAIIPITLFLAFWRTKKEKDSTGNSFAFQKIFPFFIFYFLLACAITTVAIHFGISPSVFAPFKELSKFFIVLAMMAIGLNTNLSKLLKSGIKPILLGFSCWFSISVASLFIQHFMGVW